MKRNLVAVLWSLVAAGMLAAAETPDELLVSCLPGNLQLNPQHAYTALEAQIFTGIYEGLFTYDPKTLDPEPAVARSWERSSDGKTYTFHLRSDARYSDGTRVKAQDFRNAWLRMILPEEKAEYSSLFDIIKGAKSYRLGKVRQASTVGIRARDDTTLEVELEAPAAFFLKVLCHHAFGPVAPAMARTADYRRPTTIVGNGPYLIDSMTAEELVLKKSPTYWDSDAVSIPTVRIKFSDNPDAITRSYNEERLHWLSGAMNLENIRSRGHIQVNPLFATHYYYFASAQKPWNDKRVRRGIALLLPWKEIRTGYLAAATTLIYPIPGYPEIKGITDADVGEARKSLAEAGFPEGNGLPKLTIAVPDGQDSQRIAGLMEKAITGNSKIRVEVKVVESGKYFDLMRTGGYIIGSSTWIGDFADPLTFLQMWTADSNLNDAGFSSPEFDDLIGKSMNQDGKDRYTTLSKAESILLESGEVMPIYHTPAVNVIDTGYIEGWYANPLDIHPFKSMRFGTRKALPSVVRTGAGTRLASR